MHEALGRPLSIASLLTITAALTACCDQKAQEQSKMTAATLTPVAMPTPLSSEPYSASLNEGIDFAKPSYPNFIASVKGMSHHEPWGRWSEGEKIVFQFKGPLPQKFDLVIRANAFGPNLNEAVQVKIGTSQQTFKVTEPGQIHRFTFDLPASENTIELLVPKPTSPLELKVSEDPRKLGLGLIKLQILP